MPQITYVEANGRSHAIDVPLGHTLMEGARDHGILGILADCSGSCACGTCKVQIAAQWHSLLPEMGELEEATLEMFDTPQNEQRLACQIPVTEQLEGMTVTMPERQF